MKRFVLFPLTALLALTACSDTAGNPSESSAAASSSEAGPLIAQIGDPLPFEDSEGKQSTVIVHSAQWIEGPQYVEKYDHTDTPQYVWLIADVEWTGDGAFNPLYMVWQQEIGPFRAGPPLMISAFEPHLGDGDLNGGTARGNVVFDVPYDAGHIELNNGYTGEENMFGLWEVPVDQSAALDAEASANATPPSGSEAVAALKACVATGGPCGIEVGDVYAAATVLPPSTYAALEAAVAAYINAGCIQGDEVPECGPLAEAVLAEAELIAE